MRLEINICYFLRIVFLENKKLDGQVKLSSIQFRSQNDVKIQWKNQVKNKYVLFLWFFQIQFIWKYKS